MPLQTIMKGFRFAIFSILFSLSIGIFNLSEAQKGFLVSGRITDDQTGEPIAGANIIIRGLVIGTITDMNGNYKLEIKESPPLTLQVSFIGRKTVTRDITEDMVGSNRTISGFDMTLSSHAIIGQEVVVSASRYEEEIFDSPVTIEKMDILSIRESAADTYYKALSNLKGIDVAHSSINFQILNSRGFGSTGNVRFVQLIDGMDTQAPALNFPIGNLNGPSHLDVESVELIPGASSALYGPNAFNGIVLINSKNPFNYQGLSAMVKVGINHVRHSYQSTSPLYEASFRYANVFKNKLAFKVNFSYQKADDWWGRNFEDRNPERQGELSFNPGSDLVHKHGDEAGSNLAIFPLSPGWRALARTYGLFEAGLSAEKYAEAGDLPSTTVTLTPYEEQYMADYGAENIKINASLNYRITDKIEAIYAFNWGFGTSVYTGAQRYGLVNFKISQHKLEVRGNNFMVRGYTTLENSGDSYIAEFLALKINEQWIQEKWNSSGAGVSTWLGGYGVDYLRHLYSIGLQPGDINSLTNEELISITGKNRISIQEDAHRFARNIADVGRYEPGSPEFEEAKSKGRNDVIPRGATFADQSNLIQFEGYYDFKNEIDILELQAGIMYRRFNLNSNGTIFDDIGGLSITEFGGFVQAGKRLINERLRLLGSLRYDKNENFIGLLSPRISAVYKIPGNHNIRVSYQTAFRNPTTQNQHIDLDIVSRRLLGGLPQYAQKYEVDQNSYTLSSVDTYTKAILDEGATLEALLDDDLRGILETSEPYDPVQPERIQSFEIGYKSIIADKIFIDGVFYFNTYKDFIGAYRVRKANGDIDSPDISSRIGARASLLSGTSNNTFDMATNFKEKISAYGAALELNYSFSRGYMLGGNWNWNVLDKKTQEKHKDFYFAFNTPQHKFNLQLTNRHLLGNLGFNIIFRWQSSFRWESTFAIGDVEKVGTLDAQISYKISSLKTMLKIGGDNLLNKQYVMNYGGPEMGAIFYISLTFDEFLN